MTARFAFVFFLVFGPLLTVGPATLAQTEAEARQRVRVDLDVLANTGVTLTLKDVQDVTFGTVRMRRGQSGSVSLAADTGHVDSDGGVQSVTGASRGQVTVAGPPGETGITLSFDGQTAPTIQLTGPDADGIDYRPTATTVDLTGSGPEAEANIFVGGTIDIPADLDPGPYSATFTIEAIMPGGST